VKYSEKSRNSEVKTTIVLENADPVTLLDGATVWPTELRVTYWASDGKSGCVWSLMTHRARKDGTRGKVTREIGSHDFLSWLGRDRGPDLTPEWLPLLVGEYEPEDLVNV
jgi:hypothetical protein